MSDENKGQEALGSGVSPRRMRVDAQRSLDALLEAALTVFTTSGVDAPVRRIAELAGVGLGTVYRHFPQRSDLIAAVFRREMDALAGAATSLAASHSPAVALTKWIDLYVSFLGTKRGLATALYSGEPAYAGLPLHRQQSLEPAFRELYASAVASDDVHAAIEADDLLYAVGTLCMSDNGENAARTQRMVQMIINGVIRRPN